LFELLKPVTLTAFFDILTVFRSICQGQKRLRYLCEISDFHSRVEDHSLLGSYSLTTCSYRHSRDNTLFRNFGNSFISRLDLISHKAWSLLPHFSYVQLSIILVISLFTSRLRLKRDGTSAETRFRLSPKCTSPFKSAGASVQSTAGSRGVHISGSNAGYA